MIKSIEKRLAELLCPSSISSTDTIIFIKSINSDYCASYAP